MAELPSEMKRSVQTMEFGRPASFLSNRSRPTLSRVLARLQVHACVVLLLIPAPSFAGRWGEENSGALVYGDGAVGIQLPRDVFIYIFVVPGAGLEPARPQRSGDFKSPVSTNFTTRA